MQRKAIQKLLEWKSYSDRKPLIVKGARQVGKTWVLKEFGKTHYKNYVYLNFDEDEELFSIFKKNKNPHRIVELLEILTEQKIHPESTLIIFDEIQECSPALNALKYFKENANEYHVVAAGSLLGTLLAKPKSYPVGMVNILNMYPMFFDEFLQAVEPSLYEYYMNITKASEIEDIFHSRLLEAFNYYLIIGGMPEAVDSWCKNKDPQKIHRIQKELITIYENDFTKHNQAVNASRLLLVFRSIVSQLAKENEKFLYGCLKEGARAREFELAIEWLVSAGMLNRVYNVSKIEQPLKAFEILNHFKLFLFDTGLLKQMAEIENASIILKAKYQFKGALTENFILQELKNVFDTNIHYYSDKHSEIDFFIQHEGDVIPVEVKAGEDKSAPSFKNYIKTKNPPMAIRFSKLNYKREDVMCNIPLYLVGRLKEFL